MQSISPFLWFNTEAETAATFYTTLFPNSSLGAVARYPENSPGPAGSVMTVAFTLDGQEYVALNGGPVFTFNPSVSFFVRVTSVAQAQTLWSALSEGGKTLMEFGEYPFSKQYGWCNDRFGVSWQIFMTDEPGPIAPMLMFTQDLCGQAEEAMRFYASVFPRSSVVSIARYEASAPNPGEVVHGTFELLGRRFLAMDAAGPHAFTFNEAVSFVIKCDTQAEIDALWQTLSAHPEAEQCGWVKDKFGVSWQIVPANMDALMRNADPVKANRVMQAMLGMKKLDIAALEAA